MVDKKVVIVVSIIAIIIIGLILGIRIKNLNSYKYHETKEEIGTAQNITNNQSSSSNEKISKENGSENNDYENELEANKTDENSVSKSEVENKNVENSNSKNTISNTSSENKTEKNKTEENNSTNNTSSNTSASKNNSTSKTDSTEKDPEKLAISLAKEKWGKKNSNVYFDVEDKNEKKGIYTIVVRDSNTTVEMITYKVDVNKKTVTE